jgi:MFS family permease
MLFRFGSGAPVRRLAATLYAYTFLIDLILLYPVYALLFADAGLSTAQISSLFVIWSVTSVVMEVPSGVWADTYSRRLLLGVAPLLAGACFALWTAVPAYWAFALGFALWGLSGALQSGAMEALVYEELDRLGAAHRYAVIMGRARALGTVAVLVATALAMPVFAAGGYLLLGIGSVLVCALAALAGLSLPEHRRRGADEPAAQPAAVASGGDPDGDEASSLRGHLRILRDGVAEVRADPPVRRAVVLLAIVTAVWGALEEYTPLLGADTGVGVAVVPLLVLLISVGVALGGLLAATGRRLGDRGLAATLAAAAVALAAGAISGAPAGFVAIAAAFCAFQMSGVLADARLQESISGPARATVTSFAGVGAEVATIMVYGGYAVASTVAGHGVIFAVFALPYLLLSLVLVGGRRTRTRGREVVGR